MERRKSGRFLKIFKAIAKYPQKLSDLLKKKTINFPYTLLNVQDLDMRKAASLTTSPILFILKNIWNLNKKILGEFFRKTSKLKKEDKCFLLEAATYYIHKKDKSFNKEVLEEIEEKTVEKGEGAMSLIKMAREEAREEAIKEGMERGVEKGVEIKNICTFTELSEEKVLQLKESFRKL